MNSDILIESQFIDIIAKEAKCLAKQIIAADKLLSQGSTVPFIARYRKEVTENLIDEQLEIIAKQRQYFIELAQRRDVILKSISDQDKLTDELEKAIRSATSKQVLEDLYLPYKPKKRTKAQIAKEKGLEPLADDLLENANTKILPEELAKSYINQEKGVENEQKAISGAKDILAERLSESIDNRTKLRNTIANEAILNSKVLIDMEVKGKEYKDYFDFEQPAKDIPSHRLLAILRGERDGFLISSLTIDDEKEIERLQLSWKVPIDTPCGTEIAQATNDGYKKLLKPSITNEVRSELQNNAEAEAISVFRANLKDLLMQAPYGQQTVMGLDPGYRTGCKMAVINKTGNVVSTDILYPVPPNEKFELSKEKLLQNIKNHDIKAIAIGNGTACRETESFVKKVLKDNKEIIVAIVPETGASVYSASNIARNELPSLDVSLRGAVSIARRLQDPLAELVKIEPRSLGVGQYQHDVNQKLLEKELDIAIESVVNSVGVELNTASTSLLKRVSGLTKNTAQTIVKFRDDNGPFENRHTLLKVKGVGPKAFEQAAGFLRILNSKNALDKTAVHPESYSIVEKMSEILKVDINELVGNPKLADKLDINTFIDEKQGVGSYTLQDILTELKRPGRDPRPQFEVPKWRDDITTIKDLKAGMTIEGRVSNVANFGAFVDIGIKQNGLIHVSELSNQFIDDPRKIVQVGQIVKVKILDIDHDRERIGLSIKALEQPVENIKIKNSRSNKSSKRPKRKKNPIKQKHSIQDLMQKFNQR